MSEVKKGTDSPSGAGSGDQPWAGGGFIYRYVPWVGVRCGESYTQEHLRGRGDDKNGFNLPTANLQSTNDACGAATSLPYGLAMVRYSCGEENRGSSGVCSTNGALWTEARIW